MVRVVIFLVIVAAIAFGVAWIADRPGDVEIVWLGWRIETSLMLLVIVIALIAIMAVLLWSLIRTILRTPDLIAMFLRNRRGVRGYLAMSKGLIAIGAGDVAAARKFAEEADRIAPGEPLVLLLNAQAAQLAGDRAAAQQAFETMAGRADTKLLGLHGLYVEARRREDSRAAGGFAEEAAKTAPRLAWAGHAVLEFRCAAGDWTAALAALDNNLRSGLVERPDYRRQRAVLLTARALAQATDRDHARTLVLEAVKLAPTLIPAAALAGRLLAEAGELRRASRIVEKAWQANPHPDLAEVYAHLRFGDSARDRLARVENLARKTPRHIESALIVARAAIDAQEFAKARAALEPHVSRPTQRVAMLMAELEQAEHGDQGRARGWMARAVSAARDPVWTADGYVSDRWLPVSPVSGRLDAFQWKVPLAELGGGGPVIEERPHVAAEPPAPAGESMPSAAEISERPAMIGASEPSAPRAAPSARTARRAMPRGTRRGVSARAEPVIPLVHAPDDPGPDRERERDPVPEPATEPWWHPRQLFR